MEPASLGRIIGVLLLVQLALLILPFVLLLPITAPDFLEIAARVAPRIRAAVLLLFANGALTLGIALAAFPLLSERGPRMALALVAVSVLWCALQAVDNSHILTLLSLSERHVARGSSSAGMSVALGATAGVARRWAHYTTLLAIETWFLVFCCLLLRSSLVPRPLAGLGVVMPVVHAAGVTFPAFTGRPGIPWLAVSLAVSQVPLAGWLLLEGFGRGDRPRALLRAPTRRSLP